MGGLPSKQSIYYPKLLQQQERLSVCRAAMVRTPRTSCCWTDPTDSDHDSELYDLVNDPQEQFNVYGNASFAAVQAELKNRLFLWYMKTDVHHGLRTPRRNAVATKTDRVNYQLLIKPFIRSHS